MSDELQKYLQKTYGITNSKTGEKVKKFKRKVERNGNFSLVDDDVVHPQQKKKQSSKKTDDETPKKLLASHGWTSCPLGGLGSSDVSNSLAERVPEHLFQERKERNSLPSLDDDGDLEVSLKAASHVVDEDGDIDLSALRGTHKSNTSQPRSDLQSTAQTVGTQSSAKELKVGLQSAEEVRYQTKRELDEQRKRMVAAASEETGKDASTVYRDKRGKRLESYEQFVQSRKKKDFTVNKPEYTWGAGIVQKQQKDAEIGRLEKERSRPFAIYKDDEELNEIQKSQVRWGDPMLSILSVKKKSQSEQPSLGGNHTANTQQEKKMTFNRSIRKDRYQGPPPPPNRFNIEPGAHWDGIDRSNGFEKKIFEQQANRVAMEELSYKMSVEDM
eukprot:jgi/Galph1/652/GphlegSOOS_G5309.1